MREIGRSWNVAKKTLTGKTPREIEYERKEESLDIPKSNKQLVFGKSQKYLNSFNKLRPSSNI